MVILNAGISVGHSEEITPFKEFKKLYGATCRFPQKQLI